MARVIHTDADHSEAMAGLDRLMEIDPEPGTPEADELELLAVTIETYEKERFPIGLPDPIEAIRFRMDQADLSQRDLVPYMGSKSRISEVLSGKRPLTLTMIRALHEGLGIPAGVLLQRTPGVEPDCEADSLDWSRFPAKEMVKRGWLSAAPDELSDQGSDLVHRWFRSCGGLEAAALFRTSRHTRSAREMDRYALTAWTARVLQRADSQRRAGGVLITSVDKSFMTEVAHLSVLDSGPAAARDYLAKHGIALVVEPHLPRTYLDGAAILGDRPVIGLTLRHDRLDNFWFTLMHELAHLALHDNDAAGAFYDDLEATSERDPKELAADRLATAALIPQSKWSQWEATTPHSTASLEGFAHSVRVHPSIVAGRLRHETGDFRAFSRLLGHGLASDSIRME